MKNEKKFFILILLIGILFIFISCSKKNENIDSKDIPIESSSSIENSSNIIFDEVIEASEDKIIVENVIKEENSSSNFIYGPFEHLKKDFNYIIDLDNNENEDNICYSILKQDDILKTSLTINNIKYDEFFEEYKNPLNYFYILDVDKTDNYKEIVIVFNEDGFVSRWYRFDNEKLIYLGEIFALPDENMYFEENNRIILYERIDLIEPNFVAIKYEIQNNKLVELQEDFYPFKISYDRANPITNKEDLIVRIEKNLKSEIFTIPKNSILDFVNTDKKNWISILFEGEEYWLYLDDSILVDNENVEINDMFNNLIGK